MKQNYDYPIDIEWSKAEMVVVVELLNTVEQAYEGGISAKEVLDKYLLYKNYFKAKKEEKILNRHFEEVSGYSLYKVVKAANELENKNQLVRL